LQPVFRGQAPSKRPAHTNLSASIQTHDAVKKFHDVFGALIRDSGWIAVAGLNSTRSNHQSRLRLFEYFPVQPEKSRSISRQRTHGTQSEGLETERAWDFRHLAGVFPAHPFFLNPVFFVLIVILRGHFNPFQVQSGFDFVSIGDNSRQSCFPPADQLGPVQNRPPRRTGLAICQ
jgi:hypothetical protein